MGYTLHRYSKILGIGLLFTAALVLSACGGGGSSSNSPPASTIPANTNVGRASNGPLISPQLATANVTTANVVPIVVDVGPVTGVSEINIAYVSVTVCTPGTTVTQACQTIDHVQLDTGSYGLRLLNSALYSNLNLPPVIDAKGQPIGECAAFAIGTTWGSVHLADIYLGGELAKSVPIQEIGDQPGGVAGNTAGCTGTLQNTQALLGSNGILGVGMFANDCPACLVRIVPATYYACGANNCANTMVTADQVVKNPVPLFAQDNNGVVVDLPAITDAGASGSLNGSLIFGIGTQSNNGLGTATVYPASSTGTITTTYNNVSYPSYIDSGSNAYFFDGAGLPNCSISKWVYCPTPVTSPWSVTVRNTSANGTTSSMTSFSIVNADNLSGNVIAANIGGASGNGEFVFGLPFFYGRKVYTAISGANTSAGIGPYYAY